MRFLRVVLCTVLLPVFSLAQEVVNTLQGVTGTLDIYRDKDGRCSCPVD